MIRKTILALLASTVPAIQAQTEQPLLEDFDDNRNGWPYLGDSDNSFSEIADGVLFHENLSLDKNTYNRTFISVPLDTRRDFVIETRVKFVSGIDTQMYGLVWDRASDGKRRQFGLSGNGYYKANRYDGESWHDVFGWTQDKELVKTGEFNDLRVEKIGNALYYFVNDQVVGQEETETFYGDGIGIRINAGATIEADKLYVTYPDATAKELSARAAELDEQVYQHLIAIGPSTEDVYDSFDDNAKRWRHLGTAETHKASIENGKLRFENISEEDEVWTYFYKSINTAADFQASVKFNRLAGPDNKRIGFMLGMKEGNPKKFYYYVTTTNYYDINWFNDDGDEITGQKWVEIDLIKEGENEMAVRKVGDLMYFYVNGQVLCSHPFQEFAGSYNGVTIAAGQTVEFDDFKIDYFDHSKAKSLAMAAALDQELRAAFESGKIKGAYHAAADRERKAEAERKLREASRLDDSDDKQLRKIRKQWVGKKKLQLFAKWKRPYKIREGGTRLQTLYYEYKMKGNTQYYYQFDLVYTGSRIGINGDVSKADEKLYEISNVSLTSFVPNN